MIYMLDTDTLITMIRGQRPSARRKVRERAEELVVHCQNAQSQGHAVGVSAIVLSELEFGARKSGWYGGETAAMTKVLAPFEPYDYGAVSCVPYYGQVRQALEAAGESIGAMDLLIAAHALGLDATLVTNNLAHFRRVPGLNVTDWR